MHGSEGEQSARLKRSSSSNEPSLAPESGYCGFNSIKLQRCGSETQLWRLLQLHCKYSHMEVRFTGTNNIFTMYSDYTSDWVTALVLWTQFVHMFVYKQTQENIWESPSWRGQRCPWTLQTWSKWHRWRSWRRECHLWPELLFHRPGHQQTLHPKRQTAILWLKLAVASTSALIATRQYMYIFKGKAGIRTNLLLLEMIP